MFSFDIIALLLENFEYNLEGEFAIEEVEVDQFKLDWDDSPYTRDDLDEVAGSDPTTKTSAMELRIGDLQEFMLDLRGPLSVVVETDPFWHNRLLLELDCDADDELRNERCVRPVLLPAVDCGVEHAFTWSAGCLPILLTARLCPLIAQSIPVSRGNACTGQDAFRQLVLAIRS